MPARIPVTFKMSEPGHGMIDHIVDRVVKAGFTKPTVSDVCRVVFHQVLNSQALRDRVVAQLCTMQQEKQL